jgi:hypothetical protein
MPQTKISISLEASLRMRSINQPNNPTTSRYGRPRNASAEHRRPDQMLWRSYGTAHAVHRPEHEAPLRRRVAAALP